MSFLSGIKVSGNRKTVLSNLGYLSLLELTSHFFPLITTPYLARVLGVDGFGSLAVGTAVIAYFQTFTNYSFSYYAVRTIARNKDNNHYVSNVVSRTLCAKMFLMLLSLFFLFIGILTIPYLKAYAVVILCTFSIIPGSILFADWYFQAIEDMKYITIMNIAMRFVFTLLVFVFIRESGDYLLQPILMGIGYLIPAIITLFVIKKKFGVNIYIVPLREVLTDIKNGFNLFVSLFLPTIYSNLNILILGGYNGKQAVGIYGGGIKFTSIAFAIFQILSRATYPLFARNINKHNYYVLCSMTLAFAMTIFLFVFAEDIVKIFLGKEFHNTIMVLKILAFTPIAMSLMNSYGYNYLVLQNGEKLMRNVIIGVTFCAVIMGIPMAIKYSYIGVAITDLTIQMIRAILITCIAIKFKYKRKYEE